MRTFPAVRGGKDDALIDLIFGVLLAQTDRQHPVYNTLCRSTVSILSPESFNLWNHSEG